MYLNLLMVMKKNRVSQKALAKEMGITERTIRKKLNSETDWTLGEVKFLWKRFPEEDPNKLIEVANG